MTDKIKAGDFVRLSSWINEPNDGWVEVAHIRGPDDPRPNTVELFFWGSYYRYPLFLDWEVKPVD